MITPEMVNVEIKDDAVALHPLHCRAWLTPQAKSEVPRMKIPIDVKGRSQALQSIDLKLRMGMMRLIYLEVWQAGVDLTRQLMEFQTGVDLTPDQQAEFKKITDKTLWLAQVGLAAPPQNGVEAPRIVRAR